MTEHKNMLVQTLVKFSALNIGFASSCPTATDKKFHTALSSINLRWQHLELVSQRISEDAELLAKTRKGNLNSKSSELLLAAPTLDIETFYVVVRSLMEDVAVLTPYFYPKASKKPKSFSFNQQIEWYKNHPDFDPLMTEYLKNNLGWFGELKSVRDDLLHSQAMVLPDNTGPEDEHGKLRVRFDIIKDFDSKLGMLDLMTKLRTTLRNLLGFLDFYSGHFKNRIPNDWPCYKDLGGANPKGGVQGLELLKRWSEETKSSSK
jgi:hypothetical protein